VKLTILAILCTLAGGTLGYLLTTIDSAQQRIIIAEQASRLVLLEHIVSIEIPRIREDISGVEGRFTRCNEIAAKMGVMIDYNGGER